MIQNGDPATVRRFYFLTADDTDDTDRKEFVRETINMRPPRGATRPP
jgi:hypothetical protein